MSLETEQQKGELPRQKLDAVTVRFAGDSGDGMQLTGSQFTASSAIYGNDICVLPEFPAEIRAPAGTTYGVSAYQIQFSSYDIHTPGEHADCLVVMNPAALKTNLDHLKNGGIVIANEDGFTDYNLNLAGYESNPLDDEALNNRYRIFRVPVTKATTEVVAEVGLKGRDAQRCKNFYALGLVLWLYNRPFNTVEDFLTKKFSKDETTLKANKLALKAGWNFGITAELFTETYEVPKAHLPKGKYRRITGTQGVAYGLIAASQKSGKPLFYAGYPITPASDMLHELARHKDFGVRTFQAEDEIAAIGATLGSAFGGGLSVCATSGPGMALKAETMGLAVMTELPMVVVNVQRGGPSTGLPTKPEQSDLFQCLFGRNGESPIALIAAKSPGDCFHAAFEAAKIAMTHMVPVILMSDAYLASGQEPWLIPNADDIEEFTIEHPSASNDEFKPYERDEKLTRPWALPGTPGLQHRIGGLEKENETGNVNYGPDNHEMMVNLREEKIQKIADYLPSTEIKGNPEGGELLLIGWGSTFGAIEAAVNRSRAKGYDVSYAHLRWLNPLPKDLGDVLKRYKRVVVPELNRGQLTWLLRAKYLVDAECLSKIKGRPFWISDIEDKIAEIVG